MTLFIWFFCFCLLYRGWGFIPFFVYIFSGREERKGRENLSSLDVMLVEELLETEVGERLSSTDA
jgi:hypothetical protein